MLRGPDLPPPESPQVFLYSGISPGCVKLFRGASLLIPSALDPLVPSVQSRYHGTAPLEKQKKKTNNYPTNLLIYFLTHSHYTWACG